MLADGGAKSLLQGVSQQALAARLPGQLESQVNMHSAPIKGLSRRPGTSLVAKLGTFASGHRAFGTLTTSTGGKYLAMFVPNSVSVFDLNGVNKNCTIAAGAGAYIGTSGVLRVTSQEDDAIVTNRSKVVAMKSDVKSYCNRGSGSKPMGIIQILGGGYGRKYVIKMNGTTLVSYTTVNGATATDVNKVSTSYIAERIVTGLTAAAAANDTADGNGSTLTKLGLLSDTAKWTVTRMEDVILITDIQASHANDAVTFTLECSDDAGNVNMKCMTQTVPDASDLPRIAPHSYCARIATEVDPDEDVFLRFQLDEDADAAAGTGFGKSGVWIECVAPGIPYAWDKSTLPHVIRYDDDTGAFTFQQAEWADRKVGTEVSNERPYCDGGNINDIGTFQGRTVLLSGPHVIMSRSKNRPYDLWSSSAANTVDTDPIDISSTAVEDSTMLACMAHNRDLVVFAPEGQFIIYGRTAVTPANATLVLTTAFESDLTARPISAGKNIVFATKIGDHAGMREFYTEGSTDINDTRNITQHVDSYLKGNVFHISGSANYNILLGHTTDDLKTVSVYKYLWTDTEKVQSAWSRWTFKHDVVYSFFDQHRIFLVMKVGNDYFLHRLSLELDLFAGTKFSIHMDGMFDVPNCGKQFTLPYPHYTMDDIIVVQGVGCPHPGSTTRVQSIVGNVVTLDRDMQGGNAVVGYKFRSSFQPSMPVVKDSDGVVVQNAELTVDAFYLNCNEVSDVVSDIISEYFDTLTQEHSARIIGDPSNKVGAPLVRKSAVNIPFMDRADLAQIEFSVDGPYPLTIQDLSWTGSYTKNGRRITAQAAGG